MKIFLVVIVYALLALWQISSFNKGKNIRELVIYAVLLGTSFGLTVMLVQGMEIPSPYKGIELLVKKVTTVHFSFQQ